MVARKITVVQMLPELDSGGVERGTLEIAHHLATAGHTPLVISQGGAMVDELVAGGGRHIPMKFIGEKSPRSLSHLPALRRLFGSGLVDIVHLRSRLPAWIGYLALKSLPRSKRPALVTTFHGYYSVNPYSAIMTKGQRVIAISRGIARHLRRVYGVSWSRISLIYRGIDEGYFDPKAVSDSRLQRARRWMGIEQVSEPLILMPGRITFIKGHEVLLKALAGMQATAWRAVFLGHMDPQSSYCRKIDKMCRELGLSGRVNFVEPFDDMPAAYSLSYLVVSATGARPEAFGRVVVEAQAMEKPVIASSHGGSLETVCHGTTGYLFKPNDPLDLRRRLEQLLAEKEIGRLMGIRGRKRILQRFTIREMCRQTMDVYRQLLVFSGTADR